MSKFVVSKFILYCLFAIIGCSIINAQVPITSGTNCDRAQMFDAIEAYTRGQWAPYDFSGVYPYFNTTTQTCASFNFTVIDLYTICGSEAFEADLAGYPPQISRAYETVGVPLYLNHYVDDKNCFAFARDQRKLKEFRYNRTQYEILDVKMWFGNNEQENPHLSFDAANAAFSGASGKSPKVILNHLEEENNSGLSGYMLDYLYASAETFCNNWVNSICLTLTPYDWAPAGNPEDGNAQDQFYGCMRYMNAIPYTVSPLEPNFWYPGGDTLGCRNYFETMAMNANWAMWGLTQQEQIESCLAVGPADGNPYRYCVN